MALPLALIQWTEGTNGNDLVKNVKKLEELGILRCIADYPKVL